MKKGSAFGATLLLAGTCIGGGMLALPVVTGLGGLLPSIFIYALCWLFMAATGLLYVEVCLWMGGETNLISMARRTLGRGGEGLAWLLYLFLFYSITTGYTSGCGAIIQDALGESIPEWLGSMVFLLFASPFLVLGARWMDWLNRIFLVGMAATFVGFVLLGFTHVNPDLWRHYDVGKAMLGLPVVFVAFGYQGTVPSLVHYLRGDARRLLWVILVGSAIPLVTYIVWQALILGILPEASIREALRNGADAVRPLKTEIKSPLVVLLGECFAFFALVTSFVGVTLGLRDFLADGLSIRKTPSGRLILALLTFFPPFLFTLLYPRVFLVALHFAGGLGSALLLGLLPILMVWRGRYVLNLPGKRLLPGGRLLLVVLVLFIALELGCEAIHFLSP